MSQKGRVSVMALVLAMGGPLASCSPENPRSLSDDAPATSTILPTNAPGNATSVESSLVACDLLQIEDIEASGLTVLDTPRTDPNTPGDECRFGLPKAPNSVINGPSRSN